MPELVPSCLSAGQNTWNMTTLDHLKTSNKVYVVWLMGNKKSLLMLVNRYLLPSLSTMKFHEWTSVEDDLWWLLFLESCSISMKKPSAMVALLSKRAFHRKHGGRF